jgi:LmbE family N-acetylglucosaminyl deacetylase
LVRRIAVIVALIPCLWFGGASARYLFRTRAADRRANSQLHLDFPAPTADQRILVLAPHPDDETLACGGLMRQAIRAGASVRVVFVTCGDDFRLAAEREYRKLNLQPEDYARFGSLRRREARRAASALGVGPGRLRFIGMPDAGLTSLWRRNWSEDAPLRSRHLRVTQSPYPWVVQPHAAFSGSVLLGNVEDQLDRFRPTDLFAPHPSDDHGDHAATAAFAQMALQRLRETGASWASACRMHYYLVHRGDWPQPQGVSLTEPMAPPAEMTGLDTEWHGLALSEDDVRAKLASIRAHRSQTAIMRRFLVSFARTTESFGRMPDARVSRGVPLAAMGPLLSDAAAPIALDAVDDNLLRRFQPEMDIGSVGAVLARGDLALRVKMMGPPRRATRIRVHARFLGDPTRGESGGLVTVNAQGGAVTGPPGVEGSTDAGGLTITIPMRELGYARSAVLDVESLVANVVVDRTGPRLVRLADGSP